MARHIHVHVHTRDSGFEEAKHPRADDGKFAALHGAIAQHVERLGKEADDWASRKYKGNKARVNFKGDGPTKGESLSIGTINERRQRANVTQRNAQIDALQRVGRVAKHSPQVVVQQFEEAKRIAQHMVERDGWKFDDAFDVQLGKKFADMQESSHGPGSVGRAIRDALEPHMKELQAKPAAAAKPLGPEDDWMKQLFGG
jgi:hypothetical protein